MNNYWKLGTFTIELTCFFKPHPVAFLGYLISHESHHRGQIALLAKQLGFPLNKKTAFGVWEWGVR
ncbi:DinB family protein [Paenibacillus qinlingensis]|uniref:DinB family protein n=1 Tax=Paenibacillus qinlingensis TaxID=1837343 RepID=UPI00156645BF|nr:DinB family protein [Paenibacillus qinlingensis]NQX60570.1 hypothetical protein [Paenibacillus qinlingensis]